MIACHSRDREGKTLPLIHADDTDQELGAEETGVAMYIPGVEFCKYFKILIDRQGEGN